MSSTQITLTFHYQKLLFAFVKCMVRVEYAILSFNISKNGDNNNDSIDLPPDLAAIFPIYLSFFMFTTKIDKFLCIPFCYLCKWIWCWHTSSWSCHNFIQCRALTHYPTENGDTVSVLVNTVFTASIHRDGGIINDTLHNNGFNFV